MDVLTKTLGTRRGGSELFTPEVAPVMKLPYARDVGGVEAEEDDVVDDDPGAPADDDGAPRGDAPTGELDPDDAA